MGTGTAYCFRNRAIFSDLVGVAEDAGRWGDNSSPPAAAPAAGASFSAIVTAAHVDTAQPGQYGANAGAGAGRKENELSCIRSDTVVVFDWALSGATECSLGSESRLSSSRDRGEGRARERKTRQRDRVEDTPKAPSLEAWRSLETYGGGRGRGQDGDQPGLYRTSVLRDISAGPSKNLTGSVDWKSRRCVMVKEKRLWRRPRAIAGRTRDATT